MMVWQWFCVKQKIDIPMIVLLLLLALPPMHSLDISFPVPQLLAHNGWLYLGSFHFAPPLAKLQIILNVEGKSFSTHPQNLIIQGITGKEWAEQEQLKCASMLRMPVVMQELRMDGKETSGMFQFAVEEDQRYHFVLKDCHQMLGREYDNSGLTIRISMNVLSNQMEPHVYPQKDELNQIQIVSGQEQNPSGSSEL